MILPATIYNLYLLFHYGRPNNFDKSIFKQAINFGFRSYSACILAYLVLRSDIYFVNLYRGFQEVGFYSIATNFVDAILLIVSSTTLVLFPRITGNQEQSFDITLKVSRAISFIIGSIIIFSFIFGKWFIPLIFGAAYKASLPAFYVLLPAIYFWAITSILLQFFASRNLPWIVVFIWLPSFIINIILNIIYIPRYGIVAAALTSLLAYSLTFVLYYLYLQRIQKTRLRQLLITNISEIKLVINKLIKRNEN